MATHSIYTATPPTLTSANDGQDIWVGNTFYTYGGTSGWTCTGGRVYIPAALAASLPTTVTIRAWQGTTDTANNLDTTPLREATATVPTAGGWAEATWTPFAMTDGQTVMIGYSFADQSYLVQAPVVNTAAVLAQDGSNVALSALNDDGNGTDIWQRSYYRYGTDAPSNSQNVETWGADIIADDGQGSGSDATVTAVTATATAQALPPTVTGEQNGDATVNAATATATAQAAAPDVAASTKVTGGGPATATAQAHAPTVAAVRNAAVAAKVAAATARAYAPSVTAGGNVTVQAVTATATGAALAPTVTGTSSATVTAAVATATGMAYPPVVTGEQGAHDGQVLAVCATATAQAHAPRASGHGAARNITVIAGPITRGWDAAGLAGAWITDKPTGNQWTGDKPGTGWTPGPIHS